MYVCMCVCMYVCIYVCMYVCVCMHVYMYVNMYECMYISKQAYVLCETKDRVTVENSEFPVYVAKILSQFHSSRCSIQISYQLLTPYQLSLLHTTFPQH
jgi:hypothetical protein